LSATELQLRREPARYIQLDEFKVEYVNSATVRGTKDIGDAPAELTGDLKVSRDVI
jgi:hypothetical protein